MSGRKRLKRKNSEEDFDADDGDDGMDNDDINKWACHSCTFMNRAAAYRCFVCGTRKGTSTRRSTCNDNVVEMQKTITTMVQKQVEKEKSLKRKERSLLKSATRELSEGVSTKEVKIEEPDIASEKPRTPVPEKQEEVSVENVEIEKCETPTKSKSATAKPPSAKKLTKRTDEDKKSSVATKKAKTTEESVPHIESNVNTELVKEENKKPTPEDSIGPVSSDSLTTNQGEDQSTAQTASTSAPSVVLLPEPTPKISVAETMVVPKALPASIAIPSTSTASVSTHPTEKPKEDSILQHLPERIVKKLNQPSSLNYDLLKVHKRMTGIDPIVAESEAVLLPQDWNRQKVMKELTASFGGNQALSPTTSRQSSETDSSSSEGNRSFETPLNDASIFNSKSCQIPDYMINREAAQKIFIVANGYPAYFEEFPRRV